MTVLTGTKLLASHVALIENKKLSQKKSKLHSIDYYLISWNDVSMNFKITYFVKETNVFLVNMQNCCWEETLLFNCN